MDVFRCWSEAVMVRGAVGGVVGIIKEIVVFVCSQDKLTYDEVQVL
jgi:hypothetical protein